MMTLLPAVLLLAAAPRVSAVVVYPDRAQVTRELSIPCGPRAVARFEQIPPAADPASFRGHSDAGTVEGVRAEESPRIQAFATERQKLDDQLLALSREIAVQEALNARGLRLATLAGRYDDVAVNLVNRELTTPKPDFKAWQAAFDAALATRQKAADDEIAAGAKLRELRRKRQELELKRTRLTASARRSEYRAEVQVSCPAGQQARVELTYLVGGASWQPTYEARAEEAASAVELSTYATVSQATGEDWGQARLTLSTAQPSQSATPPEIHPLRVYAEQAETKKVLVRREEVQEHAEGGESANTTPSTPPALQAAAQGLSVQLTVPEPADVPGDGRPARVFVGRSRLAARFAFRAAPKLMPFVFRVADLDNTGAFPLLPGPLDAFRNGFVARYGLERVPQGGRFHLTFGIEEGLRVKRAVVQEMQVDSGLFNSARRYHYDYRFELANHRPGEQVVELSEHIPVSELEDVTVALEEKTTAGYELKPADGLVTWKVKLAPGETKTLELIYRVDVPASYGTGSP